MEAVQSFIQQWGRGAKAEVQAKANDKAKAKDKPKVQSKPKESAFKQDADNEGRSIAGLRVLIQSNKGGYLNCDLALFLPIANAAGEFEADAAGKFEAGVIPLTRKVFCGIVAL
jgi:hypothetical protein